MNFKEFINVLKAAGITQKEYTSLEELVEDANKDIYKDHYTYVDSFPEEENHITDQNVPYIVIEGKDKDFLKKISYLEGSMPLDEELYIYPSLKEFPFERAISFDDNYELKNGENFYIELDPFDTVYEYITENLSKFCLENKVKVHVESPNENGVTSSFDIDENGVVKANVVTKEAKYYVEHYLYLAYTLLQMYKSTENLLKCNPTFGNVELI